MTGAARIAADDEAAVGRSDGAGPGLQAVARTVRVQALVMLRLHPRWLDLPVVGTAMAGLAVATARGGLPTEAARCWALARRFGSRQDFAVLAHDRLRPLVVDAVGEQTVADAETASAGWDRAEAVGRTRVLLEDLGARHAFRM